MSSLLLDPAAWSRHDAFRGYEPWLERLRSWNPRDTDTLAATLGATVSFTSQHHKLAAGLDRTDIEGSYVELCTRGQVPTRADNLHDLLNAMVWARFPKAKRALCERQVWLARERISGTGQRLRSREQDSCAMLDEGGMLIGPTQRAVFGHAALEDVVRERSLRPFLLHLGSDDFDDALAARLADRTPLPRVRERASLL